MSKKERDNMALPFEVERGFTAMPNSVSDYYTLHPRFTGSTERLYLFLLRMYNDKKGYAYPGYKAIKEHTKIGSDSTIRSAIESLEHLRLINVKKVRMENGSESNRYYFLPPIEDIDDFMRRFGEELPEKYRKRELDLSEEIPEEVDDLEELREWI